MSICVAQLPVLYVCQVYLMVVQWCRNLLNWLNVDRTGEFLEIYKLCPNKLQKIVTDSINRGQQVHVSTFCVH